MSDWADRTFKALSHQEAEAKQRREQESQRRSQILAIAPQFWDAVRQIVRQESEALGKLKPGYIEVEDFPGIGTLNFHIKSPNGTVTVEFHGAVPSISYRINPVVIDGTLRIKFNAATGTFNFAVDDSGQVSTVSAINKNGNRLSTQEVAESLLNIVV